MHSEDRNRHFRPIGTLVVLVLYVLIIIALWGSAYLTLLSRGVTQ